MNIYHNEHYKKKNLYTSYFYQISYLLAYFQTLIIADLELHSQLIFSLYPIMAIKEIPNTFLFKLQ